MPCSVYVRVVLNTLYIICLTYSFSKSNYQNPILILHLTLWKAFHIFRKTEGL
jgi:hypothetical protein